MDRQELPCLYRSFDFASTDQPSARRSCTTTPQQESFRFNFKVLLLLSQSLPHQELAAESQDQARIVWLFRQILGRWPSDVERTDSLEYVITELRQHADSRVWAQLAQTLMLTNEFTYVD